MEGNKTVLCRLTGPIAIENVQTRNGTIYVSELWDKVENSEGFQEMMENKSFYIGLDHPEEATRSTTISLLKETAGIVASWKRQADGVIKVIIDVLDTPYGRIVDTLARYGSYVGLSIRAEGDVLADGTVNPDDYEFFGADFVTVPSQKASRMKLLLEEGRSSRRKITKKDLREAIKYARDLGVPRQVMESMKRDLRSSKIKEDRGMKRVSLKEGLRAQGFKLLEGRILRNMRTGKDSQIIKEGMSEDGSTELVLRDGETVVVVSPDIMENELTDQERDALDNYIENEEDITESRKRGGSRKRRMESEDDMYDDEEDIIESKRRRRMESEDDIMYDEDGNPILTEGDDEDVLANAIEKSLDNEDELMEDEEVLVDPEGNIIVEGRHCSIKLRGKFLEAYKGRRLVERCKMSRRDSLIECIKELRRDYNRRR